MRFPSGSRGRPGTQKAARTLAATGIDHALHDGDTDPIYVLLPVWLGKSGLGFAAPALLRRLDNGALAAP